MNKKDLKISSIVVTYNRKSLLLKCLDALFRQTIKLQSIIIVDNNSSDNTYQAITRYLNKPEKKINQKKNLTNNLTSLDSVIDKVVLVAKEGTKVYYVHLKENIGGAGGFNIGLKVAYYYKYNWFWLMDDDILPLPNTLENLLSYINISKCIHPIRMYEDGEIIEWEGKFNDKLGIEKYNNNLTFKKTNADYVEVNIGCFEGMLIHRSIVDKIGYPDKNFFIIGDDAIYGYLASFHTKNLYVKNAIIIKQRKNILIKKLNRKSNRPTDINLYYHARNRFLLLEYAREYGNLSSFSILFLIFYYIKKAVGILIYDSRKFKRLSVLYKAFKDGKKKKWGKTFFK